MARSPSSKLKELVYPDRARTAMVCWLFVGSFIFSAVFAYLGGHEPIEKFVLALNLSPIGFMILAQVIIFLLGWPLEWTEIIVIFMPIFLPLLKTSTSIRCSSACWWRSTSRPRSCRRRWRWRRSISRASRRRRSPSTRSSRGVLPFMFIVIIAMVMLYMFPQIGLWLPSVLYGRGIDTGVG